MTAKKATLVTLATALTLEPLIELKNVTPHPETELVSAIYNPTGVNTYNIGYLHIPTEKTFTGFATLVTI